jgi:poly(3-hydroxybutyrate) depolymerase
VFVPLLVLGLTIRRALAAGRPAEACPKFDSGSIIDVTARVVPGGEETGAAGYRKPSVTETQQRPGSFEAHEFSNDAGSRAYKVYVPAGASVVPRAMIVMLHGCTQSADDFAAGTQMNRLADEHGFLVVYPEQTAQANAVEVLELVQAAGPAARRRRAFADRRHRGRGGARHGADPRRIYVAGLSAGAAMAVVLG